MPDKLNKREPAGSVAAALDLLTQRLLYRAALITRDRSAAKEVLQDVRCKLFFEPPDLPKNEEHLRNYLSKTVHNAAIDWLRKRKRLQVRNDLEPLELLENVGIDGDAGVGMPSIELRFQRALLAKYVGELSERRREVFTMHASGKSFEQIAEETKLKRNTVKKHYQLAIRDLKGKAAEEDSHE